MNYQEILLKIIRKKIAPNTSLIDTVAQVLQISYDAAHRRVSQKSKISIEEAVILCKQYEISLDTIYNEENKVVVEKTKEISSFEDLALYFDFSASKLSSYLDTDSTIYYSAKDIPLFYTIGGTLLSKFKLYVWQNLLLELEEQLSFEKFTVQQSLLQASLTLKRVYETSEVHEIWNDTTINSTVQQVNYFFDSGLLSYENALMILEELKKELYKIEEKSSKNNSDYYLYYNELLILNNNVLFQNEHKKSLFVPYTLLGYFITNDIPTTENARLYFLHQVKNSKLLNSSGTRDRKMFFNKVFQKIDNHSKRISTLYNLD
ncbi:hypothetical protein [Flavobacterium sp. UBA6135]|uniref:hypothetical protein n=1 Tax=Flavobacterium sp. UBA6135 TaxID=1946553 RepID=UPI0025BBA0F3|nr:hypothetical protein [Flavobacterium sp. UBA6135]